MSTPTPAEYRIMKAEAKDAEEIGRIMQACSSSPRKLLEYKNVSKEDWVNFNVECTRAELEVCRQVEDEEISAVKVVVDAGKGKEDIVGYAVWGWTAKAEALLLEAKAKLVKPTGLNTELTERFWAAMEKMEEECHPKGSYAELLNLATHPSHQRRGIGSRLVQYGIERASDKGMPIYLSGSPMGAPVYRRLGFKEIGRLEVPLGEFGGWKLDDAGEREEEVHVHVAMIKDQSIIQMPLLKHLK